MSNNDDEDGVLSRWSKRKLANDHAKQMPQSEPTPEEHAEAFDERELELASNREAAEEIDLETITEESDLSVFMKEGVPEALKKAALAKLWRSSPVFANIDGLVDYDDNFADPNLIMKTFTSAYQVGKGYLKEVLEDTEEEVAKEHEIVKDADEPEIASLESGEEEKSFEELEDPASDELDEDKAREPEMIEVPRTSLRERLGLLHIEENRS